MKRILALLLAVLLVASVFTGCSQSESEKPKDTSIVAMTVSTINTLDPAADMPCDSLYAQAVFDTLVKYNEDYSFAPRIAESWEETDDAMAILFHIRKDAVFHDGSPVTASDVVYSINTYLGTMYGATWAYSVLGAELADENTVKVNKANKETNILGIMAGLFYIVPEKLHSQDRDGFEAHPVGSGPFVFESKGSDNTIVLKANENYFLGAPEIKTLTFRQAVDMSTAVVALKTGEVDILFNVPAAQIASVTADKNLTLKKEAGFSQETLILCGEPFVSNEKLRGAVFHGVSGENAMLIAGEGEGTVSNYIFAEKRLGDLASKGVIQNRYDPELAKQLLSESGYDTSVPIKITVFSSYAPHAQVVQSDLKEIGLEVEIDQVDANTYVTKLYSGDIQMTAAALGTATGSAFDLVNTFSTQGDLGNMYKVKSPELDAACLAVLAASDENAWNAAMGEALQQVIALESIAPLYVTNNNVAFGPKIADVPGMCIATLAVYFNEIKLK